MNTFLTIVLMIILMDFYYRFRQQKIVNGLFFYSSVMSDYYEKILISKNVLSNDELLYVKHKIEQELREYWGFSQKNIDALRCRIAHFDSRYLLAIESIIGKNCFKDKKELKKELITLGGLLYTKNYKEFDKEMKRLEKLD